MKPILLTKYGETLEIESPSYLTDTEELPKCPDVYAGTHSVCGGIIFIKPVSETHFVVFCSICGRITEPIPDEVCTYGRLRQWCEERNKKNTEEEDRQVSRRFLSRFEIDRAGDGASA